MIPYPCDPKHHKHIVPCPATNANCPYSFEDIEYSVWCGKWRVTLGKDAIIQACDPEYAVKEDEE